MCFAEARMEVHMDIVQVTKGSAVNQIWQDLHLKALLTLSFSKEVLSFPIWNIEE